MALIGSAERNPVGTRSPRSTAAATLCAILLVGILSAVPPILRATGQRGASTPTPSPPAAGAPTPSQDVISDESKFDVCKEIHVSSDRRYRDAAVKSCQDMEATLLRESNIEDVETCGMMPEDDVWIDRDNHGGNDDKTCEVYNKGIWTNLDCDTPRGFICKKSGSA